MIVVGIPHGGAVLPEWLIGWERLEMPAATRVLRTYRLPVHVARNRIVAAALEKFPDATHLFFLDDDVVAPPTGLLDLLRDSAEHDLPIVTGVCTQRVPPYLPCIYHRAADGTYVHVTRLLPDPQRVDACGAAALLIRADVLRALGPAPFDWADGFSEDIAFCRRATAAGYPIVADPRVACTHLGVLDATPERFARALVDGEVRYGNAEVARLAVEARPWPPVTTPPAVTPPAVTPPAATPAVAPATAE